MHRLALARLLRDQLGEPGRAIDQLDEIVRTVPNHQEAMADLEALKEDDAALVGVVLFNASMAIGTVELVELIDQPDEIVWTVLN